MTTLASSLVYRKLHLLCAAFELGLCGMFDQRWPDVFYEIYVEAMPVQRSSASCISCFRSEVQLRFRVWDA